MGLAAKSQIVKALLFSFLILTISACGGSGGSGESHDVNKSEGSIPSAPNKSPEVTIEGTTEALQEAQLTLIAKASDSDGEVTSYLWSYDQTLPITVNELDKSSLIIIGEKLDNDLNFEVKVTVTDDKGKQASAVVQVTLLKPSVTPITVDIAGETIVQEQSKLSLTAQSNIDPKDIASIKWSHDSSLDLILSDETQSTINFTSPDILENEIVSFTVLIKHNDGREINKTHKIEILARENLAPVVEIATTKSVMEGQALKLKAIASDSDGEVVSFKWSHNASFELFIDEVSSDELSVVSANILENKVVSFFVEVEDNQGAITKNEVTITFVALPNMSPTASIISDSSVLEQTELTLVAEASDIDGQIISYYWSYPSWLSLEASDPTSSSFTIKSLDISSALNVQISLTVEDNQGAFYTTSFALVIEPKPNLLPEVAIDAADKFQEKAASKLLGLANDIDGEVVSHNWSHNSELNLQLKGQGSRELVVVSPDIDKPHDVTFSYTVVDNQGASSTATKVVTISPITLSFTIAGKVTDSPIKNAHVTAEVGERVFETTANNVGDYSIDIEIDESDVSSLVKLTAKGAEEKSFVNLVSQLPSFEAIDEVLGEDNTVNVEELFGVNITNYSTAEFVLLSRNSEGYKTSSQLEQAKANISSQEQLMLSILIKAVIDYGVALPEGVNNTFELVNSQELAEQMIEELSSSQPELITEIQKAITGDNKLVKSEQLTPKGDYYLFETQYFDGIDYKLSFYEDYYGEITTSSQKIGFTWSELENSIILELDEALLVSNSELKQRKGFKTQHFKITTYDSQKNSQAVIVEFELSNQSSEKLKPISITAQLYKDSDLEPISSEKLFGQWWSLEYATDDDTSRLELNFNENGNVEIDFDSLNFVGQWGIVDGRIVVVHSFFNFKLEVLRQFKFGYQTVMESGSFGNEIYRQGLLVKHQNKFFDEFNYQKTWKRLFSKKPKDKFVIDENDNFNYRWQKNIKGENDAGILRHHEYYLNNHLVDYCDEQLSGCRKLASYSYKLLAQYEDVIAVAYEKRKEFSGATKGIHFYRLSDKSWPLGAFSKSFFDASWSDADFNPQTYLYSHNGNSVALLYNELYCPTNPAPVDSCFDAIVMNNKKYKASLFGEQLKLEDVESGEVSYLEIVTESQDHITFCHFAEGETCASEDIWSYTYSKPELNVSVSYTGQGELLLSKESFYYGDSFKVNIEESNEYALKDISGCEGEFKSENDEKWFEVKFLKSSCEVKASFIKLQPPLQTTMLVDATPAEFIDSWYYEFDSETSGTYFGLDKATPFTVKIKRNDEYEFLFEDIIRTRVNGKNFYASKYKLWHGVNSYACWYGKPENPNFDPTYGLDATCTEVDYSYWLENTPLERSELVGRWYVNFEQSMSPFIMFLNEDGLGTIKPASDSDSVEGSKQIAWQLTKEHKLEITDHDGMLSVFDMISKNGVVYSLLTSELLNEAYPFESKHGTWSLIRKEQSAVTLEQLKGSWSNLDEKNIDGFYLFSDGVYRSGRFEGAARTELHKNTLSLKAKFNSNLQNYDGTCDLNSAECEERLIAKYHIIALYEGKAYLEVLNNLDEFIGVTAINIDESFAVDVEFPDYLDSTTYYEHFNGLIRTWRFELYNNGDIVKFRIDDGDTAISTYQNGQISSSDSRKTFNYKIIEINHKGLMLCHSENGNCIRGREFELLFKVPHIKVTLNIPESLEATHNIHTGYLKYGESLSVSIPRGNDQYAAAFDGCNINRPTNITGSNVYFESEPLTESCTFTITAAPLPSSNAERLDVTDTALKACIDKGSNEYLEYERQFYCSGDFDIKQSSLAGIENLTHLTSLVLRDLSLDEAGLQKLSQLTGLEGLSLDIGQFNDSIDMMDLDLSQLHNLKSLFLSYLPEGELILPATSLLKDLRLSHSDISELDISNLPQLNYLSLYGSKIKSIDLTNNRQLSTLSADESSLQFLSGVTPEHELESMSLKNTLIESLDLMGYDKLAFLNLSYSQLKEIDISKAKALIDFEANYSQLAYMPFERDSNVENVSITDTPLTELHVQMMPNLKRLNIRRNKLLHLDFSQNEKISGVYAGSGTINSVLLPDIDGKKFGSFSFPKNKIESFVIPYFSDGISVDLNENGLKELTVLGKPSSLSAKKNLLESVVFNDVNMSELVLTENNLSSVEISGSVRSLYLNNNKLDEFTLNESTEVSSLYLQNNLLSKVNIIGDISLSIDLSNNNLESLELPEFNNSIYSLNVTDNPLKSIKINGGRYQRIDLSDTNVESINLGNLDYLSVLDISRTNMTSFDIPTPLANLFADEVPMSSFSIPQSNNIDSISFQGNILNNILGLDYIEKRLTLNLKGTELDEDLENRLKDMPNIILK